MTIGGSVFLVAVGAILRYAVTDTLSGVDLATIGLILMIAGAVGLVVSLLYATLWSRRTVAADRPVVADRYEDGRYYRGAP
ncbi:MAG: DUF6458 family protein [Solirubrobacterales bacterium]